MGNATTAVRTHRRVTTRHCEFEAARLGAPHVTRIPVFGSGHSDRVLLLKPSLVWAMAITCALAVANLYYNQPLLVLIGRDFGVDAPRMGLIPTAGQLGYAAGMLLFVPLGDTMERRGLIVTMLLATAAALLAAALSRGLYLLTLFSFCIGAATVVPQMILPFAAHLSGPEERGRVIGTIMGGLLIGILGARTVAGYVGALWGWRAMYWGAAVLMLLLAVGARFVLPRSEPEHALSYGALLRSLGHLVRKHPTLREASFIGAMEFGAFSAFWSTLAFFLARPPYRFGSEVTGLFGLVGIAGALAAPIIGRLADRRSPRGVVGIAVWITALAFMLFAAVGGVISGLVAGVILLDLGVQAAQVSNQARIYRLEPNAHSRVNTVYMVTYFIGGSVGSVLGSQAWGVGAWPGVCVVGAGMLLLALGAMHLGREEPVAAEAPA